MLCAIAGAALLFSARQAPSAVCQLRLHATGHGKKAFQEWIRDLAEDTGRIVAGISIGCRLDSQRADALSDCPLSHIKIGDAVRRASNTQFTGTLLAISLDIRCEKAFASAGLSPSRTRASS